MHCVSSLPSRVPSWGRAAGLGTVSPNTPSPRPDGARQRGGAERAAPGRAWPPTPGHRRCPPAPRAVRGSMCNPRQEDLAAPFLLLPLGLWTRAAFPSVGERRCSWCPWVQPPARSGQFPSPKTPASKKKCLTK